MLRLLVYSCRDKKNESILRNKVSCRGSRAASIGLRTHTHRQARTRTQHVSSQKCVCVRIFCTSFVYRSSFSSTFCTLNRDGCTRPNQPLSTSPLPLPARSPSKQPQQPQQQSNSCAAFNCASGDRARLTVGGPKGRRTAICE